MRSVSTKNTTLPLWSSIVCNLGRGTEQPDLAIVAQHTLHVNLTVRISSLLPNWAAPNGGEGGIGFATLRAFAPSLRLSVPLRYTKPSARVRISSLLPNWAAPNGGEGGIRIFYPTFHNPFEMNILYIPKNISPIL